MTEARRRVAVVGGGVLGMDVALQLARADQDVVLLESGPGVGGLAEAAQIGEYTWDRYYHVILLSDLRLRQLLEDVGLVDELHWCTTKTGFFADRRFHYLSTPLDFLRFPPIGLVDKVRLALTVLRAARIENWRPLEAETSIEWLTRWSGRRVVDKLWRPLLKAKLGDNDEIVSAAFIWAIIARMYGARKTGAKKEMFGYVSGGYARILRSFEALLRDSGVEIRTHTPVARVEATSGGVEIHAADLHETFGDVVLTVPCPVISKICPTLTPAEHDRLGRVVYQGMICASMLIDRPLSDCYITNLADERLPFTAIIETTALVDQANFGGQSLIYLPRYVQADDPYWSLSDEDIHERFLEALPLVHPDFDRSRVVDFRVSRAPHVLALTTKHYSRDALPPWKTSLPGVYVANSAQIAAGTLNINETLGVGDRVLPQVLEDIRARATAGVPT